eukprot:TRINITY_DN13489_c0_g1_i1.p2 TRINITY_DN13489_c0_g1~~TRINITY_DN13489_c0_g1_i1.p2  ORF type:complete len:236 (-),score=-51.89 TRINITY_DN13489_c0_g1_i1:129-836(-)
MARLTGFEPVTIRLEGGCSIQLSYRRLTDDAYHAILRRSQNILLSGRSSRIRTYDPLVPNQVHYQAVLCSDLSQLLLYRTMCDTAKAEIDRSIAQPGSAPGLGPGGRRFESYCSDHLKEYFKIGEVSHDKHHRLSACSSVGQSIRLLSGWSQVRILSGAPFGSLVRRTYLMVDVAQLVEPWIVIPVVAGSNPVIHPNFGAQHSLVVHLVWDQGVVGSNPTAPTIFKIVQAFQNIP